MTKTMFDSAHEAQMEIERCLDGINVIKNMCGGKIADSDTVNAIGRALMDHFHTVCEGILYRICSELATPDGKNEWPSLKELRKKREYVHAPIEVGLAAEAMTKLKNKCDKGFVTPNDLDDYFSMVRAFIAWAKEMLKDFGDVVNEMIQALNELEKFIDKWDRCYEEKQERDRPPYVLYNRYYGDNDNKTDEELDELYKHRMSNKRKTMAPLYIYLVLKEHTDWDNHLHVSDIILLLEEEHKIIVKRGAVERTLNSLIDDDVNIWGGKRGDGYWYSEQKPKGYVSIKDDEYAEELIGLQRG